MTALDPAPTPHRATAPAVNTLPLAPRNATGIRGTIEFLMEFAGKIDDMGVRLRDWGEIYRMSFPNLPWPLKQYLAESYVDGFAGETVMITSPRLVRELCTLPSGQLDYEVWKKFLLPIMGNQSPFVLTGRDHVQVRRAIAAELTPARVESYREPTVELLDEMIDRLPLGIPVSLYDFYTRFTQSLILRVAFGWNCHDLDELEAALYKAETYYAAQNGWRLIWFMFNSMITMRPGRRPTHISQRSDMPSRWFARRGYPLRKHADALIHRKIAELRVDPNDSVAARLIEYGAREDLAWTDKRLRDIIATLLIAGHDTSVIAYAWATEYVLYNPDVRSELIAEAHMAVTDRYAQAVNTEALRMQSPVTAALPTPYAQDIAVGGYRIRKHTMIYVPATAVHYNQELYPEPEKFRPERWFESQPDRYGFIPFGVGPHRCPGSTFYLTDASILLHRVFGRLDLESCLPQVDHPRFIFGALSRPKGDTTVVVRKRRPAADVPWYRPGHNEPLTLLKKALLPPEPEPEKPSRCPYSGL